MRDGAHIAYQVVGEGNLDVVLVSTWFSHLEARWDIPGFAHYLDRFAAVARVISFDKLGIGLSDPIATRTVAPIEDWVDDVRIVMDTVGVERAAIVGANEGAMLAATFAATYPNRVSALVLANGSARLSAAEGYEIGIPADVCETFVSMIETGWGRPGPMAMLNPSIADDEGALQAWARFMRLSASPATAATVVRTLFQFDIRDLVPLIRVPTLVVHRRDAPLPPVTHGRYLAERIPGTRLVEVDGADYGLGVGDVDAVIDPIEEFLTGSRAGSTLNRSLATIVFADVVQSTERLATVGDRRWRELLQATGDVVRRELDRHRGVLVDTAGDGFLATFDGAARAVVFSMTLLEAVRALGLVLRIGIHVGEVERLPDGRIAGLAVHAAARVQAAADAGEILVSRTVKDLAVGADLRFEAAGEHELKGFDERWELYAVRS